MSRIVTLCVDFLTCFCYYRTELRDEVPLHARTHTHRASKKRRESNSPSSTQCVLVLVLFCHQKAVWAGLPHSDPYRSNSWIFHGMATLVPQFHVRKCFTWRNETEDVKRPSGLLSWTEVTKVTARLLKLRLSFIYVEGYQHVWRHTP
jgi:hypothetical protein